MSTTPLLRVTPGGHHNPHTVCCTKPDLQWTKRATKKGWVTRWLPDLKGSISEQRVEAIVPGDIVHAYVCHNCGKRDR